jgi:hypothetical protein
MTRAASKSRTRGQVSSKSGFKARLRQASPRRPGRQSCSARRLPSPGASVPLAAVGQASACHAGTRPIRLGVTPYRLAGRSLRACFRAVAAVPASSPAYGRQAQPGSHACGVRAGGPGEYRPTAVGHGKMARCHVSREAAHIRRLNGRGNPSPPPSRTGMTRTPPDAQQRTPRIDATVPAPARITSVI